MAIQLAAPKPRPHEVEEVSIGDDGPFAFVAPKSGAVMSAIVQTQRGSDPTAFLTAQMDWLKQGFSEDDWEHLDARLHDPDDNFDFPHVQELFKALFEWASGRPTTSASDSSRSPAAKTAGGARKRKASTSGS